MLGRPPAARRRPAAVLVEGVAGLGMLGGGRLPSRMINGGVARPRHASASGVCKDQMLWCIPRRTGRCSRRLDALRAGGRPKDAAAVRADASRDWREGVLASRQIAGSN